MSDGDAFWDNLSKKIDDVYDNPSLSSAPNSVAAAEVCPPYRKYRA